MHHSVLDTANLVMSQALLIIFSKGILMEAEYYKVPNIKKRIKEPLRKNFKTEKGYLYFSWNYINSKAHQTAPQLPRHPPRISSLLPQTIA